MKKIFILVIIHFSFCSIHPFCFSQNVKIDSLLFLLKTDKPDTNKLIHLYQLSDEFEDAGNYPEGLNYGGQVLELADMILKKSDIKNEGPVKQLAIRYKGLAYINMGIMYRTLGNYPEALKSYLSSLKMFESIGDKKGMADCYNNMGNLNKNLGNYPEALKNFFTSLKIKETIGNKQGIASSYSNIGNVYRGQGNYTEALKNYFAALEINQALDYKPGIAVNYNNIGSAYSDQAREERNPFLRAKKLDQALKNHLISLKIGESIGDKKGVASTYNNIGTVYSSQAELEQDPLLRMEKLNMALKNFFASLKIKEAIGHKGGISASYVNIGTAFVKQKKYKEAEEYLIKSKELSKKIGYIEVLKECYGLLTELDSAKRDFKGAYANHKLYILYRDSLDNEETRKKTIQSQMTFDFEKKEAVADAEHKKELENQELLAGEKSRKQKMVIIFVVCGLLLVLVFAGFIFRSLRMTRKQKNIIEVQKNIVEKQKEEVEQQKQLVEEHQKEIIDSITYARRIQRSQLPTEKYIDRTLKRLLS